MLNYEFSFKYYLINKGVYILDNFFSNQFTESFKDALECTAKAQANLFENMTQNFQETFSKSSDIFDTFTNSNRSDSKQATDEKTSSQNQSESSHNQANPFESMNEYFSFIAPTMGSFNTALSKWMVSLSQQPDLLDSQKTLLEDLGKLNLYLIERLEGKEIAPIVEPTKKDYRFSHDEWRTNPYFDTIKQFYLLFTNWLQSTIELNPNIDIKTKATVSFYIRQLTEALSPSNFLFSNPELLQKTFENKGKNICHGIHTFVDQLQNSSVGNFTVNPVNKDAYILGKTLATTEGTVVFRNDIIELIYYKPQTKTVYEKPVLIIPPFINKYYIMDLCPDKSMVEMLVKSGVSVFMISWVNPDSDHRSVTFEDYLQEGPLTALTVIEEQFKFKSVHAVGYCVGGTLLACLLSCLKKHKMESKVSSATFLTSLVDFKNVGDIGVFIYEDQIKAIEDRMSKKGYFHGQDMGTMFDLLKPQQLIWSSVLNYYLLGKEPVTNEIMFWNGDTTRIPEALHSFYLRNFYLENKLAKANELSLLDTPLNLADISCDVYCLATTDDHIVPWESAFELTQHVKNVEFVLSNYGHIVGVIQPVKPNDKAFRYHTNSKSYNTTEEWLNTSRTHSGSWWPHWNKWLLGKLGKKVKPPVLLKKHQICSAPGEYVQIT